MAMERITVSRDPLAAIVPAFDLCKELPREDWPNTVFIWECEGRNGTPRVSQRFIVQPGGFYMKQDGIPAPTLEEIMCCIESYVDDIRLAQGEWELGFWMEKIDCLKFHDFRIIKYHTIRAQTLVECAIRAWALLNDAKYAEKGE